MDLAPYLQYDGMHTWYVNQGHSTLVCW